MKIKFDLISGIILIHCEILGQSGVMAFDTGAMKTCLNYKYFADAAELDKRVVKFDGGVSETASYKCNADIALEGLLVRDIQVGVMDLEYVEKPLRAVDPNIKFIGTLGIDVIKEHIVSIDYIEKELILDEPQKMEGLSIKLKMSQLPIIQVGINDKKYDFVIDTGANTCLLDTSFLQDSPEYIDEKLKLIMLPSIMVDGNEYNSIAAVISDMSAIRNVVAVDGVIGYQILKNHKCTFDFKEGRLMLSGKC